VGAPCVEDLLLLRSLLLLLPLLCAQASLAVIIETGDGTGNTSAPSPDPGWDYVGRRGAPTAVYLGDGWVLTANHVGSGAVVLDGISYPAVPGSETRISNPDSSLADLIVFAISPYPAWPLLPIATTTPTVGTDVVLIGRGRDRGLATSWDPNGPPPPGPYAGYEWDTTRTIRWGTNQIASIPAAPVLDTFSITTAFDAGATPHEAMAADGDSGGALFVDNGGSWELAGLMFAIAGYSGQPPETALYGNLTYSADLAFYRDDILDVIGLPEPVGALPVGALLVAGLARRRERRLLAADQRDQLHEGDQRLADDEELLVEGFHLTALGQHEEAVALEALERDGDLFVHIELATPLQAHAAVQHPLGVGGLDQAAEEAQLGLRVEGLHLVTHAALDHLAHGDAVAHELEAESAKLLSAGGLIDDLEGGLHGGSLRGASGFESGSRSCCP
jgi:hypothetical protein